MSFGSFLRTVAPWYMANGRMGILLDSVGMTLDSLAERSFLGRCAALVTSGGAKTPQGFVAQCEPDVLPAHASDREIPLFPSEPVPSHRVKLSRWHQLHARRATHRGEMELVQPYFLGVDGLGVLPRIRIVHQDGDGDGATWHTLSGSYDPGGAGIYSIHRQEPTNFDFDGQLAKKSRWWAILYTEGIPFLIDGITHWDDGALWDGGQVWDGVTRPYVDDIVGMFLSWHSAHSQLAGVILAHDLASFDPTSTAVVFPDGTTSLPVGNWGSLVDPVTGLPTRLQTATWIYDRYYQ
jgi:hypothetical protein